ncbi:glycosyltransferase family 2 protein [Rhizobium paknamense]|uniref:Cellulose synthase/poly-beta-1,6-N-acetylglucosamine synthase-like glycosyltransferase n=1 Tax=Rhizobium paknamense TaxID=1206817 RepID=A0ABU0II44_9HYPH|nr:glycosyltransferase [Rhizobium paknamense]MDQ0457936.1 cellulose synthase/poly-beta-1,6-N-acetylglucosamine synthase-like glycosyltransferase [Rhizobium paknamense]
MEFNTLSRMGLERGLLIRLVRKAVRNGTSMDQEIQVCSRLEQDHYYDAIARRLGLVYLEDLPPDQVFHADKLETQLQTPVMVRLYPPGRPPVTVLTPQAHQLQDLEERLRRFPSLKETLALTRPAAIRTAVWALGSQTRAERASNRLFDVAPLYSARQVMTGRQGFWAGVGTALVLCGLCLSTSIFLPLLHISLSMLYLCALFLRAATLGHQVRYRMQWPEPLLKRPLPTYTVLVALYRERDVVPQLIEALRRLDWPAALLDIKLVCEEDDQDTLNAIEAQPLPPHFEIIRVPPIGPRTKPKALNYALSGARGEFLVIYDAEDRPHPHQLKEAYGRFLASPPHIACLQAPLIIANGHENWISSLFALEYAGLFRGLLPMLGRHGLPLPLGGTSNHFRTAVLREVGAWDPHNVTEDADLGLRLYRAGYRCQTLRCQTLEDAPTKPHIWIGQRSRWFKGWLQTWLIIMRHPLAACRDMGLIAFVVFQLMIGGMLVSSLFHPALILFLAATLWSMTVLSTEELPLREVIFFWVDLMNIFGSYAIFLALGRSAMIPHERRQIGRRYLATPLYWMMTSYAAWKAVLELRTKPFFWNKTPHTPRRVKLNNET